MAKKLLGSFFAWPVDGGATFFDGRPLLGPSKTVRGIAAAEAATSFIALAAGFPWWVGFQIALTAMAGDLASSFVKRRAGYASSSRAIGLDQIPESLLPAIACRSWLSLSLADVAVVTVLFLFAELTLSRLLFKIHVRDEPY
jgi:CDP-2,3-bis-(O-geranylgeranyl)-sn-glycerol synthase